MNISCFFKIQNMKEIILIGSYQPSKHLTDFITSMQQQFKIVVRYLIACNNYLLCFQKNSLNI